MGKLLLKIVWTRTDETAVQRNGETCRRYLLEVTGLDADSLRVRDAWVPTVPVPRTRREHERDLETEAANLHAQFRDTYDPFWDSRRLQYPAKRFHSFNSEEWWSV